MDLADELGAYAEQAAALADWLTAVPESAFAAPSVLPGWDLRTLLGHVVASKEGMAEWLTTRSADRPLPPAIYAQAFAPAAAEVSAQTVAITADHPPAALLDRLRAPVAPPAGVAAGTVIAGPRGPITARDFVRLRLLEVVVHADDFARSLPDRGPASLPRPALATTTRLLAEMLATAAPGRSVEIRIAPFVAVQAIEGPSHRRGTPPNVVETDAVTWLRVATGRADFRGAVADGRIRASGTRSDLTAYLPLLA